MVALAECFAPEKPAAEPKTRVWDFFGPDADRVGKSASQVVDRDWEITLVVYDSRRSASLARSNHSPILMTPPGMSTSVQMGVHNTGRDSVWGDSFQYVIDPGDDLIAGVLALTVDEAKQLQASGNFRLDVERIRSLKYYGNQFDSAEFVSQAKAGQLRFATISKIGGGAGYVLAGVNVASDVYLVSQGVDNGGISVQRFAYRTTGNGAAIAFAIAGSGGTAAIVGGGFYVGEKFYDGHQFHKKVSDYSRRNQRPVPANETRQEAVRRYQRGFGGPPF